MLTIKVLGSGCDKCNQLAENAKAAADQLRIDYQLEKVKDLDSIMGYGVVITPALVVNEQVKASGKVPTVKEISQMLSDAGA